MCLAKFHRMGQQQQLGTMFAGVVYAAAAAQPMKMIYVSRAHQATDTAERDSASSLYLESTMIMSAYISITHTQAHNPTPGLQGSPRPGLYRPREPCRVEPFNKHEHVLKDSLSLIGVDPAPGTVPGRAGTGSPAPAGRARPARNAPRPPAAAPSPAAGEREVQGRNRPTRGPYRPEPAHGGPDWAGTGPWRAPPGRNRSMDGPTGPEPAVQPRPSQESERNRGRGEGGGRLPARRTKACGSVLS